MLRDPRVRYFWRPGGKKWVIVYRIVYVGEVGGCISQWVWIEHLRQFPASYEYLPMSTAFVLLPFQDPLHAHTTMRAQYMHERLQNTNNNFPITQK